MIDCPVDSRSNKVFSDRINEKNNRKENPRHVHIWFGHHQSMVDISTNQLLL